VVQHKGDSSGVAFLSGAVSVSLMAHLFDKFTTPFYPVAKSCWGARQQTGLRKQNRCLSAIQADAG